jgi:predicted nucleic acid-binding protein
LIATPAYVLDACSLIHIERRSDLKYLPQPDSRMFVPDRVAREVNKPGTRLHTWLKRHPKAITRFVGEEGRLYLLFLREGLDDGEAAALAMAEQRSATLVTDDKAARNLAVSRGVQSDDTETYLRVIVPKQGDLGI